MATAIGLAVVGCASMGRRSDPCAPGDTSPPPRMARASTRASPPTERDILVVRLRDRCTGQPVPSVVVSLVGSTPIVGTLSDSTGVALLRLRLGVHRVLVRHIGHAKSIVRAQVRPGFRDTLHVGLRRSPPLLYH